MAETMFHSHFCYKSCRVRELENSKTDGPIRVQVECRMQRSWICEVLPWITTT